MAERVFNYQNIGTAYQNMNSKFGEISTLLSAIDTEYKARVNVEDEALFGDLGSQLLLDWENTSSNFPNFMTNFENWSAVVSLAAGNYSQFESDLAGFKEVTTGNYLGATAQAAGITTNFVDSSSYNNAYSSDEIAGFKDLAQYYALTGATYVDTGMVEFGKRHKVYNIVSDSLAVIGTVASAFTIGKAISTTATFLKAPFNGRAGGMTNLQAIQQFPRVYNAGNAWHKLLATGSALLPKAVGGTATGTKFFGALTAAARNSRIISAAAVGGGTLSNISAAIGSSYNPSKYASGYENANPWNTIGSSQTIGGQSYTFLGTTPSGTRLYADVNGGVYYGTSSGVTRAKVKDQNNDKDASVDDLTGQFVMTLGNEQINQDVDLTGDSVDYYGYTDSVTGIENRSLSGNTSGN